jgi:hypothetical protein
MLLFRTDSENSTVEPALHRWARSMQLGWLYTVGHALRSCHALHSGLLASSFLVWGTPAPLARLTELQGLAARWLLPDKLRAAAGSRCATPRWVRPRQPQSQPPFHHPGGACPWAWPSGPTVFAVPSLAVGRLAHDLLASSSAAARRWVLCPGRRHTQQDPTLWSSSTTRHLGLVS